MLRSNFTGKWILGSTICLLIVAGACYLWYNHSIAPYEKAAAETVKAVSEWKKSQKVNTYNVTEEVTTTPAKSTLATAEKPKTETIDVPDNVSGNAKTNDVEAGTSPAEADIAEDVPVSPYGLGPYPEVPDDPWWSSFTWNSRSKEHELVTRVLVELWNQGTQAKGGAMRNGLVYPAIRGVRYVEWNTFVKTSGESVRYISRSAGHPDDQIRLNAIRKRKSNSSIDPSERNILTEDDIPSDIKLVSAQEGGIDPYTFLDLP